MAMKYITLSRWATGDSDELKAKWEWSVHYYQADNYRSISPNWKPKIKMCKSRAEARTWKNAFNAKFNMQYRKAVIKRRLVQANWEDYNDSFGWNSGCGKR